MDASTCCQWVGHGASIEVPAVGFTLKSPLTYVGASPVGPNGIHGLDAGVNLSATIRLADVMDTRRARAERIRSGQTPFAYAHLSPEERGVYVQWLAGGRSEPLPFQELYWLYLGGIEWRCFKEKTTVLGELNRERHQIKCISEYLDDNEVTEILDGLVAVGRQVTDTKCRNAYRNLWRAVATSSGRLRASDRPLGEDFEAFGPMRPDFYLRLSEMAYENKHLDTEMAARYASWLWRHHYAANFLDDVTEYRELWMRLWKTWNARSFELMAQEERARYRYRLATDHNCTVECYIDRTRKVRNDGIVAARFNLSSNAVGRALEPYAVEIKRGDPDGLARMMLPPDLWEEPARVAFEELRQSAKEEGGILLTPRKLAESLGFPVEPVLSTVCPTFLFRGAGSGVRAISLTGVFALDEDTPFVLHPTARATGDDVLRLYKVLAAAAWLGGPPTPARRAQLVASFEAVNTLVYEAKPRTAWRAYALLYSATEVKRNSISAGLRWIDRSIKAKAAAELVGALKTQALAIVMADGSSPASMKAAEKLYKSLGQPADALYRDLSGAQPVTGDLDVDKIQKLRAESDQALTLLHSIFADTKADPEEDIEPEPVRAPAGESPGDGLDDAHRQLLEVLRAKPEWERQEVETTCAQLGLLTDGAIERLNEDAWEKYGGPLLEGDDVLTINPSLAEQYAAAA